jgi:hypothetical protein
VLFPDPVPPISSVRRTPGDMPLDRVPAADG